jgi:hypothetical protein
MMCELTGPSIGQLSPTLLPRTTSTGGTSSRRVRPFWAPCGTCGYWLHEGCKLSQPQVYPAQPRRLSRARNLQARALPHTRRPTRPYCARPAHGVLWLRTPDLPWPAHRRREPIHDDLDAARDRRRRPGERRAGSGDRPYRGRHRWRAQSRSAFRLGRALAWPTRGDACCSCPRRLTTSMDVSM